MSDILRLRLLTITAAGVLAAYFSALPEPLWTVVGWNMVFIGLNTVQIVRTLGSRPRPASRARRAGAGFLEDLGALVERGRFGRVLL